MDKKFEPTGFSLVKDDEDCRMWKRNERISFSFKVFERKVLIDSQVENKENSFSVEFVLVYWKDESWYELTAQWKGEKNIIATSSIMDDSMIQSKRRHVHKLLIGEVIP